MSSYHDLTNANCRAAGAAPRSITELEDVAAAKQGVKQGLGVALLPATAVAGMSPGVNSGSFR